MTLESTDALVKRIQSLAENPKVRLADLLPHIDNPEADVRSAALAALWNLPCEATLQTLLRSARTDVDPGVQAVAAATLGRYIWSGLQIDEALDEQLGLSESVSAAEVKQARDGLQALFQDTSRARPVRLRALESLAYDPDDSVQREIEALWREENPESRAVAMRCMGRSGQARWRKTILEALRTPDRTLKLAAIEAAGDGCIEAAEGPLLELTVSEDREIALAAIWALRNVLHTREGRKALERLGRSKDPEIKARAKAALEDLDAMDVEARGDNDDDD